MTGTVAPASALSYPQPADADLVLPAWPVMAMLWGFPLWWVLGLSPFMPILLAVVMSALLIARRHVVLVPGVLPWLAFVAWLVPCALMLDSALRLIGYGLRFGHFAAVAVTLVYVVNAPERLPSRRLLGGLVVIGLTAIVGGYLGLVWPHLRLTTPVGLLLPGILTENEYVRDLVFPSLAQVQFPYGAPEPWTRPSAPFTYANSWGGAMALITPVAIAFVALKPTRKARVLLVLAMVAAVPPAIATSNRGLFLALAASILYVSLRLALRGNVRAFLLVVASSVVAGVALLSLGVWQSIAERQEYSDTTTGRAQLYQETFLRTLDSPILGFGAPRPSYTSEISVGTQGQIWTIMFSYGFVGLALFLLFLWGATMRTWPAPTPPALWLHASLVAASLMVIYYGLDVPHLVLVIIVTGLMLRERCRDGSTLWGTEGIEPTAAPARV